MSTVSTVPMTTPTDPGSLSASLAVQPNIVAVNRRTIDTVLIGAGVLAVVVLTIAAALLTWGNRFAAGYVGDELSSQNITFPSADALTGQGRDDLVEYAGQPLDTGKEAEAYASYINGHLQGIAEGATYAELGAVESDAKTDLQTAIDAGRPQAEIDELRATASGITAQRDSLFKGETLRGLLLSAYAWSTVGMIAGIAAIAAFVAAALMAVLVVLGLVHRGRAARAPSAAVGPELALS
jgi:hypothetical protein